MVVAKSLLVLL